MPVTLPSQKIRQIEQMLDQIPLEDVVLIFSQNAKEDQRCLLVYNTTYLPIMPNIHWSARSLTDLKPDDYTRFDGPVLGFSALDVAFPNIPTHGVNFYSLQYIFDSKGQQTQYRETAYRLAKWLWEHRLQFADSKEDLRRGQSKIIELALPKLLSVQNIEHLIAVLPPDDLEEYLSDQWDSLQTISLENVDALSQIDAECWIVTLEEIALFNPELGRDQVHFTDLRFILRRAGRTNELQQICRALAHRCWQEWQSSQNPDFKKAAYTLAAEAWLMKEDVEDLVALLPHQDFEHFLETSDAIRIYRSPRIYELNSTSSGPCFSLSEFVSERIADEVLKHYKTAPMFLSVLSSFFRPVVPESVIDLGPILYKTEHATQLARSLWLLSTDLTKQPLTSEFSININPQTITDLALRAVTIYSLEEPWHKQWHARYPQLLEQSYKHLIECLHQQETSVTDGMLADYYHALREWYGCGISQDIPRSLNSILNACRVFLEKSENRTNLQIEQNVARQLIETIRLLTDHEVRHPLKLRSLTFRFDVGKFLRQVADSAFPMDIFSLRFEELLDTYESYYEQWQSWQNNLPTYRPSNEELRKLLDDYTLLQRIAYAPAHELRILDWACEQDIARIERLREALGLGAMIQVRVLNPQVILRMRERVQVEVENIGGAIAHDFEITLSPSRRFEFLSLPNPKVPGTLDIRQPYRLEWNIRPLDSPLELHFSYRFRTHDGQLLTYEEDCQINATPAKVAGIAPRGGNPYQAGAPVIAERFFGREKELKRILNLLLGGVTQPVLLRGPRRIGKSSILHQLRHLLTQEGELQRIDYSADNEFALRRIYPVLTSLQEISDVDYIPRWFQAVFMTICDSVGLEYQERDLTEDFDRFPYHAFTRHINRLFDKRPNMRLLILIDEWDEQRHLSVLGNNLRALMQQEQRINWIISSTWTLKEEMSKFSSPFYNQTAPIELKEMNWESASQLIVKLSERIGVDWHGDAIVSVLEQTGRRPYLIQFLCQEIINHLYDQKMSLVDHEIVSVAISKFIKMSKMSGQPFGFLWENDTVKRHGNDDARLHWLGRLILWALDTHAPAGLTRLEIKDLIQTELRHRKWEISEVFFEEEFGGQITELEYIFDAIMLEGQRFKFSIPLAQQWFHHMIDQHPDPVQHAYLGIVQDYEEWNRTQAKENKND